MTPAGRVAALATLVVVVSAPASAQPEEVRRAEGGYIGKELVRLEIDDRPPPPPGDDPRLQDIAFEHYERGNVLYIQGDYKGAVAEFVASYCLSPYYTVLKDIGQAYERSLEYERAVAYLERYVLAVPPGARRGGTCDPDPAEDKRNVSARIQVLQTLPANIQVATNPPGAMVTLTSDAGVRAQDRANARTIEVVAGRYTMTVELAGYEPVSRTIEPEIGKPYSYYFELSPRRGRLQIQTVPGDARIFVDDRLVGLGSYQDELPGGSYQVLVEAAGYLPERRLVEVVAGRETRIPVSLPSPPASGRTQLLIASGIAGTIGGGVGLNAAVGKYGALAGIGLGAGIGIGGGYLGIPRDISVGSSSYIITAGLVGGFEAGFGAAIFTDDGNVIGPLATVGLVGGAAFAAVTASRLQIDAGDAALLNSGALWGGVAGFLLSAAFHAKPEVGSGLVLSGLNLGLVTGALLGTRFDWSRGHVALIDLAGLGGIAVGVALEGALYPNETTAEGETDEKTAHFALAGMALGLAAGGWVTRNLDAPALRVRPTTGRATTASGSEVITVGFSGSF